MTNSKLHVLITRPTVSGQLLANRLQAAGISSICQPLFDYQPVVKSAQYLQLIADHPKAIVIFISVAAVNFAESAYGLSQWKQNQVLAVGPKSQLALSRHNITAETSLMHSSEGLLEHAWLQQVCDRDIIIVRGDGGRELLAEQLTLRGANVYYLQTYQRQWRSFSTEITPAWQKKQINCIVVTSNAILEKIIVLMNTVKAPWKFTCLWVVASERIQRNALKLGIVKVVNANGANDEAITTAIRQYGMKQ